MFSNVPETIEKVIRRFKNIPIDAFPGATIINGRLEYYVDTVLQEVCFKNPNSENLKRMFIVIWCGWPDNYATIEPEENLQYCAAFTHYTLATEGQIF